MMIELLIKYIQDKGYMVDVIPRALLIRKYAGDELYRVSWSIPKHDLRPDFQEYLHDIADSYCWQIEQAIKERVKEKI